jgi:hypothetical protein
MRRWLRLWLHWVGHPSARRTPARQMAHESFWDGWREGRKLERERQINAPMIHLFERCPDCGKDGAHHTYKNRAGEKAGVRCG